MTIHLTDLIDPGFLDGDWFPLPQALERDLAEAGGPPRALAEFRGEPLPTRVMQRLATGLILATDTGLPYHGWQHAAQVMHDGTVALRLLDDWLRPRLWQGLVQAVRAGLAGHDCDHPGGTFPSLAPAHRVAVGMEGLAVEQHSAALVDARAREAGMTAHQRLVAVYVVYATAFGVGTDEGRQLGLDRIDVGALLGLIARAADLRVPDDPVAVIAREFAVQREGHPWPRPATRTAVAQSLRAFLLGVTPVFNRLDDLVERLGGPRGYTADPDLRWRQKLHAATRAAFQLTSPELATILDAQLVVAGRDLDAHLAEIPSYGVETECAVVVTAITDSFVHEARTGGELAARHRLYTTILRMTAEQWGAADFDRTRSGGLVFSIRPDRALSFALALKESVQQTGGDDGTLIRLRVGVAAGREALRRCDRPGRARRRKAGEQPTIDRCRGSSCLPHPFALRAPGCRWSNGGPAEGTLGGA